MSRTTSRRSRLRQMISTGTALAVLGTGAVLSAAPAQAQSQEEPAWVPTISVSNTVVEDGGTTVTVRGWGFDPEASPGTRPPLAGEPAGVYVVFGRFADDWRPSEGAASSSRTGARAVDVMWAVPESSQEAAVPPLPADQVVTLEEDGTFETELEVARTDDTVTDGNYGVYTYPGSGAVNAQYELYAPMAFAEGDVTAGALDWGVKSSFRNYVTGSIAKGSVTRSDGALLRSDDTFRFLGGAGAAASDANDATFDGAVHFTGHDSGSGPALDLTVSQPRVALHGDQGVLLVDLVTKPFTSAEPGTEPAETVTYDDVPFATLDLSGVPSTDASGLRTYSAVPATLTAEGAAKSGFDAFYTTPEQQQLDPVTVTVALDDAQLVLPRTAQDTVAGRPIANACPADRVPDGQYTDVPTDDTHALAVRCASGYEIAQGYADGRFGLGDGVTRGQMASFLARAVTAAGGTLPGSPANAFGDDDGSTHHLAINQLAEAGIVLGRGDRTYGADEVVTRAQMASFLVRAHAHVTGRALPVGSGYFTDVTGVLQQDDINRVAGAGIAGGRDGQSYDPQGPTLRGQMATFLVRLIDVLVVDGVTPAP